MIMETIALLGSSSFIKILLIAVVLDTFLGVLRAFKYRKFNSAFGIDGALRKVAMLVSVMCLMLVDLIVHIDMMFFVPKEYLQVIGITKLGLCEFFALLFILYESVSILKNLSLIGVPIPAKLKNLIEKFLHEMTEEMDNVGTQKIEKKEGADDA